MANVRTGRLNRLRIIYGIRKNQAHIGKFSNQRQKTVARYQEKQSCRIFKEYGNAVETLLTELWLEIFDTDRLCLLATGGFGPKNFILTRILI